MTLRSLVVHRKISRTDGRADKPNEVCMGLEDLEVGIPCHRTELLRKVVSLVKNVRIYF